MLKNIYAIYHVPMKESGQLYLDKNDHMAMKGFQAFIEESKKKNPRFIEEESILCKLGTIDTETMEIKSVKPHKVILTVDVFDEKAPIDLVKPDLSLLEKENKKE